MHFLMLGVELKDTDRTYLETCGFLPSRGCMVLLKQERATRLHLLEEGVGKGVRNQPDRRTNLSSSGGNETDRQSCGIRRPALQ